MSKATLIAEGDILGGLPIFRLALFAGVGSIRASEQRCGKLSKEEGKSVERYMAEEDKDAGLTGGEIENAEIIGVEINQCPECGADIDIAGLSPFSKINCPHCDQSVRVRTILGNFQITRMLGEGGMSQVFLAEDLALSRQVALKILHQDLSRDAALMALFEREAKLTASINHPNVVKVYTVGSDAGYFYIAMELVDNVSLEERINSDGQLQEREALDLLHDVAAGLRTALQGGLIHRDIKPGNILLTADGNGKLVDFGLAVQQGGEDEVEDLWATPFYVPPEKLDNKPDDFRGDIYSLGATFFHALAGRPPFDANTASLDELREIKARPVSLRHMGINASAYTIRLIDQMMAYKPEVRPKSYDRLLAAIEEAQSHLPGNSASRARRQSALAEKEQGLSIPAWIGIGGGSIALIGLVIAMILGSGSGGADLPDNLVGSGGDRVLTAGEKAVAARYNEARDLLLGGRSGAAAKAFDALLVLGDIQQPTLGWTQFNAGLAGLVNGESGEKVQSKFEEMSKAVGYEDQKGGTHPEADFFRKAGRILNDPLPVMPDAAKELKPGSLESIALLAYGLKNWNHGQFDSAMSFLDAFTAAEIPAEYGWMNAYRGLVEPYRADAERLKNLPKPSIAMSVAEMGELKGKLEAEVKAFKTKGGARALAESRLKRVDDLLAAKKALAEAPPEPVPSVEPPPVKMATTNDVKTLPPAFPDDGSPAMIPPAGDAWTPEAVAERDRLVEMLTPSIATMANFDFATTRDSVASFTAETAAVKQLQTDYLAAIDQAAAFKEKLVISLAKGDYEGKLARKQGLPIDCKVVSADAEKLVVDLMFGPNDLPWVDVAPAWLLAAAQETWLNGIPDDSTAADWIQAAWYARQTGLKTEAEKLAETLAPLSDDFAQQWKRLEPLP
ncbi:MAG: serine/threonine protein kinase [Verrucomicrobiae bacterium]|nr:serine/threonine protein kinase [Verrucomicrobiae bacterium]